MAPTRKSGLRALAASTPAAGVTRTYDVDGAEFSVNLRPVQVQEALHATASFPAVQTLLFGLSRGGSVDQAAVMQALLADGAVAAAALIAFSAGEGFAPDVEDFRRAILSLPGEIFADLLATAVAQTAPKGLQDFLDRALRMWLVIQGHSPAEVAAAMAAAKAEVEPAVAPAGEPPQAAA